MPGFRTGEKPAPIRSDEPAALDPDDHVDALTCERLRQAVEGGTKSSRILQQRRDVVEENPGFREVGHVANLRFEIHRHLVVNPVSRPLGAMWSTSTRSTRAPDGP